MNTFDTADYLSEFAALDQHMGTLTFPTPFTVSDYRKWFDAAQSLRDEDANIDEVDDLVFVRQYRGAIAVADVRPYESDSLSPYLHQLDTDDIDEFTIPVNYGRERQQSIDVGLIDAAYDDVPMPWMAFVVSAAEDYMGRLLISETDQQRLARRNTNTSQANAFQHDCCVDLLPAMGDHRGYIVFREPLTKSAYKKWRKAFKGNPKKDPRGVDNSWRMRALAGAVTLVQDFKFRDLDWNEITADKCAAMPLEIASFIIETAGTFLSRRLTVKNF